MTKPTCLDIVNKHYPWNDHRIGAQAIRAYLCSLLRYGHLIELDAPADIVRAEERLLIKRKENLDRLLGLSAFLEPQQQSKHHHGHYQEAP